MLYKIAPCFLVLSAAACFSTPTYEKSTTSERSAQEVNLDTTSPSVTVLPDEGALRDPDQTIVVTYSEAMAVGSLSLAGSLEPLVLNYRWISIKESQDTLVIPAPVAGWPARGDLFINAADRAGNNAVPVRIVARLAPPSQYPLIHLPMHAVRVKNDDGSKQPNINPTEVAAWVEEANRVFSEAGIVLDFTADLQGRDWTELASSLVNQMDGAGDAQWLAEKNAANAEAAKYPGKATMIFRWGQGSGPTGGGFSWTEFDFIAMPGFMDTWVCGHQNITLFAHEVGHYLGLSHTFAGIYDTVAGAEAVFGFDSSVFDGDGLLDTPPDPLIAGDATNCDPAVTTLTLNGIPFVLPRSNIMSYIDDDAKTVSESQALRIRQGALLRSGQDLRRIIEGDFLPLYEGEAVVSGATTSAGGLGPQTHMRASFLGLWSGDAQLWWQGAAVASMAFRINVPMAGIYRLYATITIAPDFGIHQFFVNGHKTSAPIDFYSPMVGLAGPVDIGVFALSAGNNTISLRSQGKNFRSSGYGAGIDYMLVQKNP